jgi:hypothetical protein|tara:strand:- start:377 stop:1162 length:786 start_codon:yes stop_codon:yes gene_type:complete
MGYFNIELKPTLTGANCITAFGNAELVADWEVKTVPTKKAFKVLGVTCIERGTNGATQTSSYELIFASPDSDGTAPSSLGTVNATLDGTGFFRHLVGVYNVTGTTDTIDTVNVHSPDNTDGNQSPDLVIEPSRIVNADGSISFDGVGSNGKICIGVAVTSGLPDFGTAVLVRGAIAADNTTTIPTDLQGSADGDPNAENVFAVGDVLVTGTGDTVGTVASISAFDTDHQDIILTANNVDAIADNEELCNANPLTFVIHCEY